MKGGEGKEEEIPEVIDSEIEAVIKALKKEKSPGPDKITNEQIKYGGRAMVTSLVKIFNRIIKITKTPKAWKKSDIIVIYKKGDRHKI